MKNAHFPPPNFFFVVVFVPPTLDDTPPLDNADKAEDDDDPISLPKISHVPEFGTTATWKNRFNLHSTRNSDSFASSNVNTFFFFRPPPSSESSLLFSSPIVIFLALLFVVFIKVVVFTVSFNTTKDFRRRDCFCHSWCVNAKMKKFFVRLNTFLDCLGFDERKEALFFKGMRN